MKKINFDKIKKIHFIGIGGIGISAIAKLMLVRSKEVSGSDLNLSDITMKLEKMGAKIFIGQKKENLPADADLVVYSPAVSDDNGEMIVAREKQIPAISYPEALGLLLNDKFGIAICGTHGKSTTTSMIGLVLANSGLDPSVVVGSKVPEFDGNLKIGRSDYFVAEACEYKRDFLEYYPKIIVLNNIELDHTDYYKDIDDFRSAFDEFITHLSEGGILIMNGDDEQVLRVKEQILNSKVNSGLNIISFGFGENNDLRGYDFKTEKGKTRFKVNFKGVEEGEFVIKLPGKFNVYNALAAITAGLHLGIDAEKIKKTLANFGGIWRRFEIKGGYKGAIVVSDYAHHPTAVRSTIEAAREYYPGHRIVAIFQPHQHNRTKMLYQDFLKSFDGADALILVEIFDVAGREEKKDQNVSSRGLAEDIGKINRKLAGNIFYAADPGEARKKIDEHIKKDDIILIMGAGDIYKVADDLARKQ